MKAQTAFAILFLVVACRSTGIQTQRGMPDEEVVRSLDDRERIAALNRDIPALEQLWSDQITINAPNNRVVIGRRTNLDTFVRGGIINFSSFERAIEFIRIDGDFAVIMGLETVKPVSDAPSAGLVAGQLVTRRFTNVWKNEADAWRLYWRHANVIPAAPLTDAEMVSAASDALVRFVDSWNRAAAGDVQAPARYGDLYWPDAELVDPSGMIWNGQPAIQQMHVDLWRTAFKGSNVRGKVRKTRRLSPTLMIADFDLDLALFKAAPSGSTQTGGAVKAHLKHVMEKRGGAWKVVAAQNTFYSDVAPAK